MHSDLSALLRGKAPEHLIIQIDELAEQPARRIELQRKARFREVDLDHCRACLKRASDICLRFINQVGEKSILRVVRNPGRRIEKAQSRGGDDRLLQRK